MGDALQIMLDEGKRLLSADIDFFSVYVLFESIIYFNVIFIYSFSFLCECVWTEQQCYRNFTSTLHGI